MKRSILLMVFLAVCVSSAPRNGFAALLTTESFTINSGAGQSAAARDTSAMIYDGTGLDGASWSGGSVGVNGPANTGMTGTPVTSSNVTFKFHIGSRVEALNASYGAGNWTIANPRLTFQYTLYANNARFGGGAGIFDIIWVANDDWAQTNTAPLTNPPYESTRDALLPWSGSQALLIAASYPWSTPSYQGTVADVGTVRWVTDKTGSQQSAISYQLALDPLFVNDVLSASPSANDSVSLYLMAVSDTIGMTIFTGGSDASGGIRPTFSFDVVSVEPAPALTVTPGSTDFGPVALGAASGGSVFTIGNGGTSDLAVSSLALNGGDSAMFTLSTGDAATGGCGATPLIPPGASCAVQAIFTPLSDGAKSTSLRIVSNDPDSPTMAIPLNGAGYTPVYDIGATVSGGNGTIACDSPVSRGSDSHCVITPATGYHLASLLDNGVDVSAAVSGSGYTIGSVTSGHNVVATFALNSYAVGFSSAGNGSLTGETSQIVPHGGATSAVTAVPDGGYYFVNWTGNNGFTPATDNPLTVNGVTASCTVTANFAPKSDQAIGAMGFSPATLAVNGTTVVGATADSGLSVSFTTSTPSICALDGTTLRALAAGVCTVVASQSGNRYYNAALPVERSITVDKATAVVTLSGLSQSYDGSRKSVTAVTTPAGLAVSFTYDGSSDAPVNAGSYAVMATVTDSNYAGSATGTLVISLPARTLAATVRGAGSVTSSPQNNGAISCSGSGGGCATMFPHGAGVQLMATPGAMSLFAGWGGDCSGSAATCTLTMDGDKTVSADFTHVPPLRLMGVQAGYYDTLTQAYAAMNDADSVTLLGQAVELEGIILDRPVTILFRGGYDAGFTLRQGFSLINGSLTVGMGRLTVENLVIR